MPDVLLRDRQTGALERFSEAAAKTELAAATPAYVAVDPINDPSFISYAPAPAPITDNNPTRILTREDNGRLISITSVSGTLVTIAKDLPDGFGCSFEHTGPASTVQISPATGVILRNSLGEFKTAMQYSVIAIINIAPDVYNLVGATKA